MPAYVDVDASVAGAWLFAEQYSANAQPVLAAIAAHRIIALAPDRFTEELLRICQKKTMPQPTGAAIPVGDAWARFLDVTTSPINLLPSAELHERAWMLAMSAGITTHDGLYLALAELWGAELWTLDEVLASRSAAFHAAVHDLRIEPFPH